MFNDVFIIYQNKIEYIEELAYNFYLMSIFVFPINENKYLNINLFEQIGILLEGVNNIILEMKDKKYVKWDNYNLDFIILYHDDYKKNSYLIDDTVNLSFIYEFLQNKDIYIKKCISGEIQRNLFHIINKLNYNIEICQRHIMYRNDYKIC